MARPVAELDVWTAATHWLHTYGPHWRTGEHAECGLETGLTTRLKGHNADGTKGTYWGLGSREQPVRIKVSKAGVKSYELIESYPGGRNKIDDPSPEITALPGAPYITQSGTLNLTQTLRDVRIIGNVVFEGASTTVRADFDVTSLPTDGGVPYIPVVTASPFPNPNGVAGDKQSVHVGWIDPPTGNAGLAVFDYTGIDTTTGAHKLTGAVLVSHVFGAGNIMKAGDSSISSVRWHLPVIFENVEVIDEGNSTVGLSGAAAYIDGLSDSPNNYSTTIGAGTGGTQGWDGTGWNLNDLPDSVIVSEDLTYLTYRSKYRGSWGTTHYIEHTTRASLTTSFAGVNNDVAIVARVDGAAGEAVSVEFVVQRVGGFIKANQTSSVVVAGSKVTFNLTTDANGVDANGVQVANANITSNAIQVRNLWSRSNAARALATCSLTDTAGNGRIVELAETFLSRTGRSLSVYHENYPDETDYHQGRRTTVNLAGSGDTVTSTGDNIRDALAIDRRVPEILEVSASTSGTAAARALTPLGGTYAGHVDANGIPTGDRTKDGYLQLDAGTDMDIFDPAILNPGKWVMVSDDVGMEYVSIDRTNKRLIGCRFVYRSAQHLNLGNNNQLGGGQYGVPLITRDSTGAIIGRTIRHGTGSKVTRHPAYTPRVPPFDTAQGRIAFKYVTGVSVKNLFVRFERSHDHFSFTGCYELRIKRSYCQSIFGDGWKSVDGGRNHNVTYENSTWHVHPGLIFGPEGHHHNFQQGTRYYNESGTYMAKRVYFPIHTGSLLYVHGGKNAPLANRGIIMGECYVKASNVVNQNDIWDDKLGVDSGAENNIVSRAPQNYAKEGSHLWSQNQSPGWIMPGPLDANANLWDDGTGLDPGATSQVSPAPQITAMSPNSGEAGTVVTFTGSNFSGANPVTAVQLGGVSATGYTIVSDTQLTAVVPPGLADGAHYNWIVTNSAGTGAPPTLFFFQGPPPPAQEEDSFTVRAGKKYRLRRWGLGGGL